MICWVLAKGKTDVWDWPGRIFLYRPYILEEAERLELQHQVFNKVFDNRLIFPPIPQPQKILDCGYGTGSWAIETAEQHPRCKVDDLNRPFTFPPNYFDLVHSRLLATGINRDRWPSYIRDIQRVLKPGGWVQLVEIYFNVQSDNGSITEQHALRQWSTQLMGSLEEVKDLRVGTRLRNLLTAAGLTEVDARMIPLPLSAWSNDPRMRDIGAKNRDNVKKLLPALGLYPFTQRLRMPPQQFAELIARAQQEADTHNLKAYFPLKEDCVDGMSPSFLSQLTLRERSSSFLGSNGTVVVVLITYRSGRHHWGSVAF
ncbi:S-adenosyl-L-methionine-dependent methyltransferase [Aspergillus pseudonomiae]|uniref:S-adenosyl-L-methionine-dependent methyltransferase n=1 Tax=Aspergillus pseudonomiae TaxID=1506151 RepID=A0A5N7D3N3_9EURO|nr:S-adenosyl-L-methionine-dependent methyltransferase [Aspergillus pseudonomiae]KAE8400717.1 S-adenosyl-L-methionine-dependent methyltransferase [Aspergillus pseudonomiae]